MPGVRPARDLGHRVLVLEPVLGHLEVGGHEVDRVAVLARDDAPGRERPAVPQPLDVVDDRHRRVAGPQEVRVQRVHVAVLGHGADARDQGLGGHLAAEHPLAVGLRLATPEQVDVERLDVEERDELVGGGGHGLLWRGWKGLRGSVVGRVVRLVEPGEELLELQADLLTGRQGLVAGQEAAAALLGARERVVLLLERRDDLADLLVGRRGSG